MAEVRARDGIRLHVEVDGDGPPVTVFAHGLTNSCTELAAFTPAAPGTKVRFCFRGHGHSDVAEPGSYRFEDFAGDVDTVARAYGATQAVGTSLGCRSDHPSPRGGSGSVRAPRVRAAGRARPSR